MAIALATKLSHPISKVKGIAMGAIMHDVGKALISPDILNKEDPTPSELAEIKKHPLIGYNLIKDIMDASPTAKIAILMHHEQVNGNGYPMKLQGDKIHYSAKIVTICDAFDQAVNDKKIKNAYQTTDAVEYVVGASGHVFDKSFVEEFIKIVPIYSEGTIVLLSNGIFAIVVKNNPVNMTRPIVRAFYNPKTNIKYDQTNILDLRYELSIKIIREINVNVHEIMK
jgi:HD-GYP domain-containing protein (c-di-GMP phosphodiesterase class II)